MLLKSPLMNLCKSLRKHFPGSSSMINMKHLKTKTTCYCYSYSPDPYNWTEHGFKLVEILHPELSPYLVLHLLLYFTVKFLMNSGVQIRVCD